MITQEEYERLLCLVSGKNIYIEDNYIYFLAERTYLGTTFPFIYRIEMLCKTLYILDSVHKKYTDNESLYLSFINRKQRDKKYSKIRSGIIQQYYYYDYCECLTRDTHSQTYHWDLDFGFETHSMLSGKIHAYLRFISSPTLYD